MLKSTIALLAVLFVSAASKSSDQFDKQRQFTKELLDTASAKANIALNVNTEKKVALLKKTALEIFQPLHDDIQQHTAKMAQFMIDVETPCKIFEEELNNVLTKTSANSNKCIAEAIAKHQSASIGKQKLDEITKTIEELKAKLPQCGSDPRAILCISEISAEAIALTDDIEKWISNNPENIDEVLSDFKTSLNTCWAKTAPANFIGEIDRIVNNIDSCLSKPEEKIAKK